MAKLDSFEYSFKEIASTLNITVIEARAAYNSGMKKILDCPSLMAESLCE